MNKKHLWGILIVLTISAYVIYSEIKATSFAVLLKAADSLVWSKVILVFALMLGSYACEAMILHLLAKRPTSPKHSIWAWCRIPIIQSLFNAITPLASGGQASQLAAMVQMGIEGGRATSVLMMKFIIYQLAVFVAYIWAFVSGYHLVVTKFSGIAILILLGFVLHVSSIIFLLAVMFAHDWTVNFVKWLMGLLAKFINPQKVAKWEKATMEKIATFYNESQKLKQDKGRLVKAAGLTVLQLLCYYSIPFMTIQALGIHASWLTVTETTLMIIMFMAVIPIPGASGGAEFSFQTLFSMFITSSGQLVLGMFIWRFVTYFFGMILGIFGWIIRPKKVADWAVRKEP